MADGTGRIYRRGNVWWIDYSFRGERYRESSGSTKKKVAKAKLRKRMAEMGKGALVGPAEEDLTVADLLQLVVDDYVAQERRSTKRVRTCIAHLKSFFGAKGRAIDLTTDRITAYVGSRKADGVANGTIKRELATLRRAFTLARRARRLSSNPHVPSVAKEPRESDSSRPQTRSRSSAASPSPFGPWSGSRSSPAGGRARS